MRIRFLTNEVYQSGAADKWPRFAKGEVIDASVLVEKLGLREEPTAQWSDGFLNRWVQRGAAEEVGEEVPLGVSGPDTEDVGEGADDAVDYEKLTRAELDELAAKRGLDVSAAKVKADVIAALVADDEKAK